MVRDRERQGRKNAEKRKKGDSGEGSFFRPLPTPSLAVVFRAHFSLRQLDSNVKVVLFLFFMFFLPVCDVLFHHPS